MNYNFNVIKLNLNKNNLILSSVTNLSCARCWSPGGLLCSVRYYRDQNEDAYDFMDRERERIELKTRYQII